MEFIKRWRNFFIVKSNIKKIFDGILIFLEFFHEKIVEKRLSNEIFFMGKYYSLWKNMERYNSMESF